MRTTTGVSIALVRQGLDQQIQRKVRRDLRRGLTTGSNAYRRAMAEAQAEFDRAMHVDEELDATRKMRDGVYVLRADGRGRGRDQRSAAAVAACAALDAKVA